MDQTGAQAAAKPEEEPLTVPGTPAPRQSEERVGFVGRRRASVQARVDAGEARLRDLAEQRPVLGLPFPFLASYQRLNLALLAGSLAFRLFMWLLPFALLVAGLLSLVVNETDWDIGKAVHTAGVSGAASQQVGQELKAGQQSWWIAVLVGLALLLWTGRSLARAVTMMHAHVWEMRVPRQSQLRRVANGALLFVVFLVAVCASALSSRIHVLGWVVGSVVMTVIVTAAWLFISRSLPNRATTLTDLLPGALVVGIGMTALKTASTVYLPNKIQRASEMYGTLGVAGAILLWLFIIGQLIVCAALLNAVWTDTAHPRPHPVPGGAGAS